MSDVSHPWMPQGMRELGQRLSRAGQRVTIATVPGRDPRTVDELGGRE